MLYLLLLEGSFVISYVVNVCLLLLGFVVGGVVCWVLMFGCFWLLVGYCLFGCWW